MNVDNTKPWVESETKLPKLGEVIAAILKIRNENLIEHAELLEELNQIEIDVTERLEASRAKIDAVIEAHIKKKGPAHGETKSSIGLSNKENLPAAKVQDIINKVYRHEWVTPQILSLLIEQALSVDTSVYMRSGLLPLSAGRLLGRVLTNQMYYNANAGLPDKTPSGQVSYLLSTEEDYVTFAEFGQGRVTDFSEGGSKTPIGVTRVNVREGNIVSNKGQPISLNNITTSGEFVQTVTGLEWGFGEDRGNFYDSNFYPTFVNTANDDIGTTTQEVEAALFDPTVIYKPDGTVYLRNLNTTKHNFNELYVNQTGIYPFNDASFLSSNNVIVHTANTQIIQQNNIWGIIFDFLSGDVGISDWLPEGITRSDDKVLSRQAYYHIKETIGTTVTGFENGQYFIRLSTDLPWGYEKRDNFDNSNFVNGSRYSSVFLPINDIIDGFNKLSADDQKKVVEGIDKELLTRVCLCWDNEFTLAGVMRIPFYYTVPGKDYSWHRYVDIKFTLSIGELITNVAFSAYNFDASKRPSFSGLDLINTEGSGFTRFDNDLSENPLHPKVFKGCFLETGGHLTAYTIGHRQYICYYKHAITSVRNWIIQNLTPTIDEKSTRIVDIGMMPGNRFYNDNTRILPLLTSEGVTTYLTRLRNKKGKYDYGTFTTINESFDVLSTRATQSSEITWLDRKTNKNFPVLVDNSNLRVDGINTTGLVFSEVNGFIGYQQHGFDGTKFSPVGATEIENVLKEAILVQSLIKNPYAIFFYYEEMLHFAIASRDGTKSITGFDVCVGAVRVDTLYNGTNYTIRQLTGFKPNFVWGNLFEDYPVDLIRGRESESFDDVFITNKTGIDATSTVYINYPELDGRYYSYEIVADSAGYKYPAVLTPQVLNIKEECGYGKTSPHVFFGSFFAPFMLQKSLYVPDKDIFKFTVMTSEGTKTVRDYYMGWKGEIPIYTIGEHITVNGVSLLLDEGINLPITAHNHKGKVFISYFNETFSVYTTTENEQSYPTEPDNSILFAGYFEKINDQYVFSFHAPRGFSEISSQDFINSLLPVIDGKQMAVGSQGSTFPAVLGRLSSAPRQYYFKK